MLNSTRNVNDNHRVESISRSLFVVTENGQGFVSGKGPKDPSSFAALSTFTPGI